MEGELRWEEMNFRKKGGKKKREGKKKINLVKTSEEKSILRHRIMSQYTHLRIRKALVREKKKKFLM